MLSTHVPPERGTNATTVSRHSQVRRRRRIGRSSLRFYFFASPWLLGFLVLTVFPLGYALMISFTNFDGISERLHWVGFNNYLDVFHDTLAWAGLLRTVLYAVITVPCGIAGGLGLALLLNRRMRAVGLFRTIFYLPSVVPVVATAIMFQLMFDRDVGGINAFIELFHGPAISWLIDPTAFLVLIIMVLWGLGGGMIISLAGLQGVPAELLEAARVDGANAWYRFWRIILPMLSPVLFFQVVTNMIYALQTLVQPLLISPGGGAGQNVVAVPSGNQLYMVHVYAEFFYYQRFGYGSALLWVLFALILLITLLIFRSSALWVYYEIDQGGNN
ncbi:putative ABC transporter permease protein YesP [Dictyobacter alpinus]|uniref:Putative ABC transporter permease protein YesP n=1 Tax=Dictyobacter alpinus TaxID=2014873 RepID=A0A402BFI5_9CHLR|nr:sugar ABC transporter permease [Dictyobacter alpinus]GCE30040.1 putative ABC transporter permease protein YesP [Dictyobacter alpinus]